ncbi:MFS transporter [Lipingzhangella sp. LS1_29]|uniref:MFS transporter n=1 Tax=Lipingzhangella rawalii TaxID=2055835 RepID=A0ABU2H3A2_9ACTN|nr:MFS transporter [Lipingzhangella rawalii]MDS1269781.1 MFS transporter [Lipingzhangella rawalii]
MRTDTIRRAGPREWAGLAVLALPTVLLGLDVTVLYLALPTLAADLQPSGTQELWIMDIYGFLIAGLLITMGSLGDRIGRRRLLMIGAIAFAAASVMAAYSTSAEMLIAARAALGIAGATLMPSTLALISTLFPDARQRALAIGVWATMFSLGMAAGPLVGGVLLHYFWWGAAFLVALPLLGLVLLTGPFLLPEYRAAQSARLDLPSVLLSLAAILPVVYAVKDVAAYGPNLGALLALVTGTAFGIVFVRRQRQLADPLLDLRLFASRAFSAALAILLVGLVGVGGTMFLVTQHLQFVEGLSPLVAGAWMGPPALAMFLAAIVAPLMARHIRPGMVMAATLALSTVGYLLLGRVDGADNIALVVAGYALVYLGLGAIAALGTDLVIGAAPADKAGSASATSETVQELGIAVGVAVLGSLTSLVYRSQIAGTVPSEVAPKVADTAEESLAGASSVADELPARVLEQTTAAFTSGLNLAAQVTGVVILVLAVVCALLLRNIGRVGTSESP